MLRTYSSSTARRLAASSSSGAATPLAALSTSNSSKRLATASHGQRLQQRLAALHTSAARWQASPAPAKASQPSGNDKFVNSNNAYYIEEMHRLWKQDPSSVHPSWNVYFSGLKSGLRSQDAVQPPPNLMSMGMEAAPVSMEGSAASSVDDHLKVSRPAWFGWTIRS